MTEPADPKSKTILVVDDEETICDFYQMILMKEGFQVMVLMDGKSALNYVKGNANRKVDLAVLDLMMPGLGGYDLVKEFQAPELRHIPLILATARVLDAEMVESLRQESNVHDFLKKPVDPIELKDKVHAALGTAKKK